MQSYNSSAKFKYLNLTTTPLKDETYYKPEIIKGEKVHKEVHFTPTTKLERLLTILFYNVTNKFLQDKGLAKNTLVIEKDKFGIIKEKCHNLISTYEDIYDSLFKNKAQISARYKYLNFDENILFNAIGKKLYSIIEKAYNNNLSNFPLKQKDIDVITKLVLDNYTLIIDEFKLASLIRKQYHCFEQSQFSFNEIKTVKDNVKTL